MNRFPFIERLRAIFVKFVLARFRMFASQQNSGPTFWERWSSYPEVYGRYDNSDDDRYLEGAVSHGNNGDDICLSRYSSPERRPGNVARFFWDLFDNTDEAANDNATMYYGADLQSTWDEFCDGTSDGRSRESGVNGRNVWDFEAYEANAHSELLLNCLEDQVANGGTGP